MQTFRRGDRQFGAITAEIGFNFVNGDGLNRQAAKIQIEGGQVLGGDGFYGCEAIDDIFIHVHIEIDGIMLNIVTTVAQARVKGIAQAGIALLSQNRDRHKNDQ